MAADSSVDVTAIQATLAAEGASWTAGETSMSVLSTQERRIRLGADPPDGVASFEDREEAAAAHAFGAGVSAGAPSKVDLTPYVQPIRNQGACGSCVSFGTIATMEGTARFGARDPNLAIDLSEAQLFYCHAKADGRTCSTGWWPDRALDAVRDKGVVDEACFPYTAGDQECRTCADADERTSKITAWKHLGSIEEMKDWLATAGPAVGCFKVYDDFFAYKTGVYRHQTGAAAGGHCVCIIGYDDNQRAWIAKNSWGTTWGDGGFFRIGYGECGIDFEMWGVDLPETQIDDVWLKRKQVSGTWAVAEPRNSSAFVVGSGWKNVGGGTDAEHLALLTTLQSARASKTAVDVRLVNDRIVEVYVY
ncbi:C1 family peptidase [Nocardioides sp.]|uniref:C1 family peptidase n=1 Tax=Nocardioides sp. TaxID=35761 RepID=UPI002723ED47|nr:C1 family peptidase [Nocardioides sp.]MDO9454526.1 C1 family peptidase [Nocardioides sp.]